MTYSVKHNMQESRQVVGCVFVLVVAICAAGCGAARDDGSQANAASGKSGDHGQTIGDGAGPARREYESLVRDDRATVEIRTTSPDQVVAPNDAGLGYVDPETGKIAWRALVCRNSQCATRDAPFTIAVPNTTVDVNGDLVLPAAKQIEAYAQTNLRCPTCGQLETLEQYEPPNVAQRRAQLMEELAASREARSGGTHIGSGYRTPAEIMYEISTLPKLYLLPE